MTLHRHTLLPTACLALAGCFTALPGHAAAITWTALNLQTAYSLQGDADAYSINQRGDIAAISAAGALVVVDTATGSQRTVAFADPLYPSGAIADLNNRGQTTGSARDFSGNSGEQAFLGDSSQVRALGTLAVGGRALATRGSAVNDLGQVVGQGNPGSGVDKAFISGADGSNLRHLGALAEYQYCDGGCALYSHSEAFDINNAGQVVGYSSVSASTRHAFITDANGGSMRDLGTLGGGDNYSVARAVNAQGQAVGASTFYAQGAGFSNFRGFVSGANGGPLVDLGRLGVGDTFALGLNDDGVVVGKSQVGNAFHAFIHGLGGQAGMQDLNNVVSLAPGVYLTEAFEINNRGQILAMGSDWQAYLVTATVATAVPEPHPLALLLAGLGALGWVARRRRSA